MGFKIACGLENLFGFGANVNVNTAFMCKESGSSKIHKLKPYPNQNRAEKEIKKI